jgi:hypothetical protein
MLAPFGGACQPVFATYKVGSVNEMVNKVWTASDGCLVFDITINRDWRHAVPFRQRSAAPALLAG